MTCLFWAVNTYITFIRKNINSSITSSQRIYLFLYNKLGSFLRQRPSHITKVRMAKPLHIFLPCIVLDPDCHFVGERIQFSAAAQPTTHRPDDPPGALPSHLPLQQDLHQERYESGSGSFKVNMRKWYAYAKAIRNTNFAIYYLYTLLVSICIIDTHI